LEEGAHVGCLVALATTTRKITTNKHPKIKPLKTPDPSKLLTAALRFAMFYYKER
jgi:hypothetical protein